MDLRKVETSVAQLVDLMADWKVDKMVVQMVGLTVAWKDGKRAE